MSSCILINQSTHSHTILLIICDNETNMISYKNDNSVFTAIFLITCRKSSNQLCNGFGGGLREGNGEGGVYEEPDKLASSGQGNYELTQCPAYESTTSKPQPQPTEVQSSHYEM